jgi:hypothetical protein
VREFAFDVRANESAFVYPDQSDLVRATEVVASREREKRDIERGGQAFENLDAAGVLAHNVPLHRFG